jgi:hypothetical protein
MVNSWTSDITSSNFRIEDKEIQNCIQCEGETKHCRYCGALLNWLNRKPIDVNGMMVEG